MKKSLLITLFLFVGIVTSMACNFEFSTKEDKKTCKAGEEFVIDVKLTLTHRTCVVTPDQTKFKPEGIQVLGATKWKEVTPGVWTRQIKVKVLDDSKKKIALSATRTCEKEGGYGIYSLNK